MKIKHCISSFHERFIRFAADHPIGFLCIWSLFLNFLLELLGRRSLFAALGFLFLHPYLFAVNALIVLLTVLPSLFFRRRLFVFTLLSTVWVGLGVTNCILMGLRNSPLSAIDFGLLRSCLAILNVYLKLWQIILLAVLIAGVFVGLFFLFRKCEKQKRLLRTGIPAFCVTAALLAVTLALSFSIGALSTEFPDLPDAYDTYGFPYSFSVSILDRGVRRPADYSDTQIDAILSSIESSAEKNEAVPEAEEHPNFVFVQLETFFDVNRLAGITFSENPVPVFTALKESSPAGYLTVPSIGGGTANTEFEVLTGMDLSDFGAGEYPYQTILHETTCESVAYDLKTLGYGTHALHNHAGTFYTRNEVYSSLGFDTFTPLEYMEDPEYNALGWAKDKILTGEILSALRSTEEPDFVFAVSVQAHGRYPDEAEDGEDGFAYDPVGILDLLFPPEEKSNADLSSSDAITVSGIDDASLAAQYTYYVNQLHEVDTFLGALLSSLTDYPEPVILVLYGDHLPALSMTPDLLGDGSTLFQTEYVIWSNREALRPVRTDLNAYQLAANVLDYADIHEGVLTKLHQNCDNDENYTASLQMLEYDMLYGDMDVFNGINPYLPTAMKMGTYPVTVLGIYSPGNTGFYVRGEHFTEFSSVQINGRRQETEYVDAETLFVPNGSVKIGDSISVIQAGEDHIPLGESNRFTVEKTE